MADNKAELAFEILAREHSRMLMAYLRALIDDPSTIEDLYQETMLVAWRRLEEVDLAKPFGPWLRGVAANLVLAHHRKRKGLPTYLSEAVLIQVDRQFESVSQRPGDTWDDKVYALHECIESLSEPHRRAIRGRYFSGLGLAELAEQLDASTEACKKRLVRARKLLAKCLEQKHVFVTTEMGR